MAAALAAGAAPMRAEAGTRTVRFGEVALEFVRIEPGSFTMGADRHFGDADESPPHRVTLTQAFYLGKYEVTQAQWEAVMGGNPSRFRGQSLPVESVSWNDCQIFLARLGELTGEKFALPTEAQWEYACRAGTGTPWSFGDADAAIGDYAWCGENSGGTTHPVGTKAPNPWGLHDMHGNVGEWCADWYGLHTYDRGDVTDPAPRPPAAGSSPVWRGGAWGDNSGFLRSSYRNCNAAASGHHGIGLRCVLLVPPAAATP